MTTRRTDGFVDIEDYAVLGDGRTAALQSLDGRVDWWPLPTLDAPPVFSAVLDPEKGGFFLLAPTSQFEVDRRYLEKTNVLETTYTTSGGIARVTSTLNSGSAGRLPWTELAFRVEVDKGEVEFALEFVPGDRFEHVSPYVTDKGGVPFALIGDQLVALVSKDVELCCSAHKASGRFVLAAGERRVFGLVATDDEPLFLPSVELIDARIDHSIESWRRWCATLQNSGEFAAPVERSALALKTLITEETGAIAAAATTSLPERVGGDKNWDYRFAWVRDSSFVLDALITLGLHEEVHGAMSWLLSAIRKNGSDLAIFYTLSAELPGKCSELDAVGYRHSRPVRSGNGAARQIQLGTYGDLFDAVNRYVEEGHLLDAATGKMLSQLADQCCEQWRKPDSGIWELEERRHYTISKIGCWVALDRALRLFEAGQVLTPWPERWRAEREEIASFIEQRCWSKRCNAYAFYADGDELDAAVLLAGRTGYERGERLSLTSDAVLEELSDGPYVYRYSGAAKEEGAFIACSFWLVEALAYCGRLDEARRLMQGAVGLCNDVGILSEQAAPGGHLLGNIPQALSHLALINAAHALRRHSS